MDGPDRTKPFDHAGVGMALSLAWSALLGGIFFALAWTACRVAGLDDGMRSLILTAAVASPGMSALRTASTGAITAILRKVAPPSTIPVAVVVDVAVVIAGIATLAASPLFGSPTVSMIGIAAVLAPTLDAACAGANAIRSKLRAKGPGG